MKFRMKLITAVLLIAGLTGCNGIGKKQAGNYYGNNAQPIGYYSGQANSGKAIDRSRGIITNMTNEGRLNPSSLYPNDYNGELADNIANKINTVPGVNGAHVLLEGKNVLAGFTAVSANGVKERNAVLLTVSKIVPDRTIYAVTNHTMNGRIQAVDKQLHEGRFFSEVKPSVKKLILDLRKMGKNTGISIKPPVKPKS